MSVVAHVEGLSKSYGRGANAVHAVVEASFTLEANRIHGLLGRGVAASTRFYPQAKGLGEWLRSRSVHVQEDLL